MDGSIGGAPAAPGATNGNKSIGVDVKGSGTLGISLCGSGGKGGKCGSRGGRPRPDFAYSHVRDVCSAMSLPGSASTFTQLPLDQMLLPDATLFIFASGGRGGRRA